jgi:hypothetical protein
VTKKNKATAPQKQARELWDNHLKGNIAGFISLRIGQNEKSPARINKAVREGNLDAARRECKWLKKTDEGFLYPIFVKNLIDPGKSGRSSDQTTVGNKTYEIPGPKLTERLEKAWGRFLISIEQPAVSTSS